MKFIIVLLGLSLFAQISLAQNYDLSHFHNRFEIKTNEANEKIIVDKTLINDLSIQAYIKNLALYLTSDSGDEIFEAPTCKGYEYENPDPELMKSFVKAFDWMKKSNLGAMLVDPKFLEFISKVEIETKKFTDDPQFVVVANMDNSSYFYKKSFVKFMNKQLTSLVKSYFNSTMYLKPVTYITEDYANFIVHKKLYHQNILSYYLETANPSDLGLTELEKNRALSSIIDSKLSFGFGGYWESNKIKKNFDGHGLMRLEEAGKDAEKRWSKHQKLFESRDLKVNSIFSEVTFDGSSIAINTGDKKTRSDDKPSYTFDNECPEFQYDMRRKFEFARIALGMSPIPYSSQLFKLVKSKYQPQALSEGMYVGYLEASHQLSKKEAVIKQSMNPLLK